MTANTPDAVRAALLMLIERCFQPDPRLQSLHLLSGGASQELWSFDVLCGHETHSAILRRNPGGTRTRPHSASMAQEAAVIRLTAAEGVPVPQVLHVLEPEDGLGAGYVMRRVEGETLAPRILRDHAYETARRVLARQLGEAACGIHRVAAAGLRHVSAARSLDEAEAQYRAQGMERPVVMWALRWLRDHLPPPEAATCLVHGDFRNGNIVVGPEGLRAVLDWEGMHLGDPMEDLGWLCVTSWRFGEIDKPVGGFGTREDLFAGYEAACGTLDAARVRFWEVLGVLRWGRMCGMMEAEFRSGDASVEKAAIGRRASETEIDLLAMLAPRSGYAHA